MRYLFIGPSLPDAADRLAGSDVRVLGPIAARDLLRLPLRDDDVVGIVDGFFHQRASVRHKEILASLAAGVRVLGAASMGALRAAEMDRYGMEGIGSVYAAYRAGQIVADDEVALLHGPAESGYPAFSQPLVNLRATLAAAAEHGVLEEKHRDQLISLLAAMPYPRRTYRILTELATGIGLATGAARGLEDFCREHTVDLKRADALLLLDRLTGSSPRSGPKKRHLRRTVALHHWELGARGEPAGARGLRVSHAARLRVCQLFARGYEQFHRRVVLELVARECARQCLTHRTGQPLVDTAVAHGRHRGFYAEQLDPSDFGFLTRWTAAAERRTQTPEQVLPAFVVRSFRMTPGMPPDAEAIARLEGTETFTRAGRIVEAAGRIETRARRFDHAISDLAADRVISWFAARWQVDPVDIEFAALDRGLESMATFLDTARAYYLLARYDPAAVELTLPESVTSVDQSVTFIDHEGQSRLCVS
jgi:hypothetical protein